MRLLFAPSPTAALMLLVVEGRRSCSGAAAGEKIAVFSSSSETKESGSPSGSKGCALSRTMGSVEASSSAVGGAAVAGAAALPLVRRAPGSAAVLPAADVDLGRGLAAAGAPASLALVVGRTLGGVVGRETPLPPVGAFALAAAAVAGLMPGPLAAAAIGETLGGGVTERVGALGFGLKRPPPRGVVAFAPGGVAALALGGLVVGLLAVGGPPASGSVEGGATTRMVGVVALALQPLSRSSAAPAGPSASQWQEGLDCERGLI